MFDPKTMEFQQLIQHKITSHKGPYLDLTSGEVYQELRERDAKIGIKPCCQVMRNLMKESDEILESSDDDMKLKIRYYK